MRVILPEDWEELSVEHQLERFGDGVNFRTACPILKVLSVAKAHEHFKEVVPNEVVLRVLLAVLFVGVRRDALHVQVGQLQGLAVDERRDLLLDQRGEDVGADAKEISHGIRARCKLVHISEPLVD